MPVAKLSNSEPLRHLEFVLDQLMTPMHIGEVHRIEINSLASEKPFVQLLDRPAPIRVAVHLLDPVVRDAHETTVVRILQAEWRIDVAEFVLHLARDGEFYARDARHNLIGAVDVAID